MIRVVMDARNTTEATVMDRQRMVELPLTSPYPIGRLGKPDDVAAASVFLASNDNSFVTQYGAGYRRWNLQRLTSDSPD
jgi:NAD(P)-dependent dehydrogenase (short-subunit alcohol dehydrogenase family)